MIPVLYSNVLPITRRCSTFRQTTKRVRPILLVSPLHTRRNRFLVLTVFRNAATGWETRPRTAPRDKQADSDEEGAEVDRDAGLVVSRDDWRAVCAVLVGQREDVEGETKGRKASGRKSEVKGQASGSKPRVAQKPSAEEPERRVTRRQARAAATETKPRSESPQGGFIAGGSGDGEGGGFVPASDDEGGGGFGPASDDEDQEGSGSDVYSDAPPSEGSTGSEFGPPSQQRMIHSKAAAKDDDSDLSLDEDSGADIPLTLTVRQEREARLAFALFFPGVDANDPGLATKRIGIREVADAAKVLKEKLSTDDVSLCLQCFSDLDALRTNGLRRVYLDLFYVVERARLTFYFQIIEMLSMFSSGPAGTVGLEGFGRMAVMAKLI